MTNAEMNIFAIDANGFRTHIKLFTDDTQAVVESLMGVLGLLADNGFTTD